MAETTIVIKAKNLSRETIAQLKADINATTQALQDQGKLTAQIDEKNKQVTQSYTGLTIALGATAAGLGLLTRSIVTAAMTQQKLMMGLSAVEGGAKGAEQAMKRLIEVAKLPGLTLQQATQGYISLRAIDMQAGLAERSLKAFGNALVTVGKGAPELNLVVLALTQMSAKGKVLGQDLRQLQEQLPQIRKVMKTEYGTADLETIQKQLDATGETADQFIEKMIVGFEKLPKVTGGAANAVENFGDTLFRTKAALGEALLPYLVKVLDTLSAVAVKFQQLSPATRGVIGEMIAVGAGVSGLAFALMGINKVVPEIISVFTKIVPVIQRAGYAMVAFAITNPWIALGIAIAAVTTAIILYVKHTNDAKMNVEALSKSFDATTESMKKASQADTLIATMTELSKKTQLTKDEEIKYKEAKDELIKLSPMFATALRDENLAMSEQIERAKGVAGELKKVNEERLKIVKSQTTESLEVLKPKAVELVKKRDILRYSISEAEKTLKENPNAQIDLGEAGTLSVEKYYAMQLNELNKVLDEIVIVTAKIEKAQSIFRPPPGLKSITAPTPTEKPLLDFETISKKLADFKNTGLGSDMTKGEELNFWTDYLKAPENLTEDALIGIKREVKHLTDEINKTSLEAKEKWQRQIEESRKEAERLDEEQIKIEEDHTKRIEAMRAKDLQVGKQTGEAIDPITGLPMSVIKEAWELRLSFAEIYFKKLASLELNHIQIEEKDLANQSAIRAKNEGYNPDTGLTKAQAEEAQKFKTDWFKKTNEEQKKLQEDALDEALKIEERHREKQLRIYTSLAESISSVFAQVPEDLIKNFNNVSQVLKNLLNGILNSVTNAIGKALGDKISTGFMDIFKNLVGETGKYSLNEWIDMDTKAMQNSSNSTGTDWGSMAGSAGTLGVGIATQNPVRIVSGVIGLIGGMSHDDPYNDLMARTRGTKVASYKLGQKSAKDMLDNFTVGFEGGANNIDSRSSEVNNIDNRRSSDVTNIIDKSSGDPELHGLLKEVLSELKAGNKYEFYLDSDPIASKVKRVTDKKVARQEWSK